MRTPPGRSSRRPEVGARPGRWRRTRSAVAVELLAAGRPRPAGPGRSTAMRSPSSNASSWSWVTKSVVIPSSRWIAWRLRRRSRRMRASSGAEGLVEQQHPRAVRERARQRDALLLTAGELASAAARRGLPGRPARAARRADAPDRGGSPPRTRRAELHVLGHRHAAGRARSSGRRSRSRASARARPRGPGRRAGSGRRPAATSPAISRRIVLLPLPDGPSSTQSCPAGTSSVTFETTGLPS